MKGLKVYIPADLEEEFRRLAMQRYGYGRGSISRAAEDALRRWVKEREVLDRVVVPDDPVGAIRGMLRHVEKRGVELQHEAKTYRAKRARVE